MDLGIDPGNAKGYAVVDPTRETPRAFGMRLGTIVAVGRTLDELVSAAPFALKRICVEYQYGGRIMSGEVRARDIIKLSFRAGFALAEVKYLFGVEDTIAVVPQVWKNALFRNGVQVSKDVYSNRLEKMLTLPERKMLPKNRRGKIDPDVLDAVGIAWALAFLTPAQRALGKVTWEQCLPKGRE